MGSHRRRRGRLRFRATTEHPVSLYARSWTGAIFRGKAEGWAPRHLRRLQDRPRRDPRPTWLRRLREGGRARPTVQWDPSPKAPARACLESWHRRHRRIPGYGRAGSPSPSNGRRAGSGMELSRTCAERRDGISLEIMLLECRTDAPRPGEARGRVAASSRSGTDVASWGSDDDGRVGFHEGRSWLTSRPRSSRAPLYSGRRGSPLARESAARPRSAPRPGDLHGVLVRS